jgi:hypothetical protein
MASCVYLTRILIAILQWCICYSLHYASEGGEKRWIEFWKEDVLFVLRKLWHALCGYKVPGKILLQVFLYSSSFVGGFTFK